MNGFLIGAIALTWLLIGLDWWIVWQLLRQNGRILLKFDALEQQIDQALNPPKGNGDRNSLTRSRINRDGLKAGFLAPDFRLPRLDDGELSLSEFRGCRLLLVFSDPHCGPCNQLAPKLQQFHRDNPEPALAMVSRGQPKENRAKMREHGLTFPIALQQHWEISRLYAMFVTPVAYLIDPTGIIIDDVAIGVDSILALMDRTVSALDKEVKR
jgi:peroxiredoxin